MVRLLIDTVVTSDSASGTKPNESFSPTVTGGTTDSLEPHGRGVGRQGRRAPTPTTGGRSCGGVRGGMEGTDVRTCKILPETLVLEVRR